jgi:LPPG:FO 2-phospho-L-lactate transferase
LAAAGAVDTGLSGGDTGENAPACRNEGGLALNVVVLVGGVGGAKLAYGLAQILPPEQLTIIVNTGDDFWMYGLRICPDLDTILYTLSGLVDPENDGWGVAGDTTTTLQALQRYGEETWFRLGDQDIATHLLRTQWWHEGVRLTEIERRLAERLGVRVPILPMADAPVATMVDTVEHGELDFQTYFVRYRWQATVRALRLVGVESATMTPEVEQALHSADGVIIGPSNPWLSIEPILAVPGVRDTLVARDVPRVAISPIVGGAAIKGPAAKLMGELGYEPSARAVADYYQGIINGFVYDERDAELEMPVSRIRTLNTIMTTNADRIFLAKSVMEWVSNW